MSKGRIAEAPLTMGQRLLDSYAGYFGGLTCLAWSPDGKYVVVRSRLREKNVTDTLSRPADKTT